MQTSNCISIAKNSRLKERLVALEHHPILNVAVLIQIQPRSVSALPTLKAIGQHPVVSLELYCCLGLRQQLVLNPNVTVGSSANHYLLVLVLAATITDIRTGMDLTIRPADQL